MPMVSSSTNSRYPELSEYALNIYQKLTKFVEERCIPAERIFEEQLLDIENISRLKELKNSSAKGDHQYNYHRFSGIPPIIEELKSEAKKLGLWNLFLMEKDVYHSGLSMVEYGILSEIIGRSFLAPEATNCAAPDTGNMEVLAKYGNKKQQLRWLNPLMSGRIRSTFLMTEPLVASSDATNIETSIRMNKDKNQYVINGRKWWSTGALDPRCELAIVMGKIDVPETNDQQEDEKNLRHKRHSMILVPMNTPGVKIIRPLTVFGYDDAPHGHAEVLLDNVCVPIENLILGEGQGFKIAQGRLGPGRIHHCMRAIGIAERIFDFSIKRVISRIAFKKPLAQQGTIQRDIAECRLALDQARLFVIHAAKCMDVGDRLGEGARFAQQEIAMIKVIVPRMALQVMDTCLQFHGGMGVSQDTIIARAYASMRTLRLADGPDEVHLRTVARFELNRIMKEKPSTIEQDFKVQIKAKL